MGRGISTGSGWIAEREISTDSGCIVRRELLTGRQCKGVSKHSGKGDVE